MPHMNDADAPVSELGKWVAAESAMWLTDAVLYLAHLAVAGFLAWVMLLSSTAFWWWVALVVASLLADHLNEIIEQKERR